MKRKDDIANTNEITVLELRAAFDHLLVHKRAVTAVEVFDRELSTFADHFAVITADRANIDHDVAFRVPAEDGFRAIEFVSPAGLRTIIRSKKSHPTTILGVM